MRFGLSFVLVMVACAAAASGSVSYSGPLNGGAGFSYGAGTLRYVNLNTLTVSTTSDGAEFEFLDYAASLRSLSGRYGVWYGGPATTLNVGFGTLIPDNLPQPANWSSGNYAQFGRLGGGFVPGEPGYIAFRGIEGGITRYGWIEIITAGEDTGVIRSFAYTDTGAIVAGTTIPEPTGVAAAALVGAALFRRERLGTATLRQP